MRCCGSVLSMPKVGYIEIVESSFAALAMRAKVGTKTEPCNASHSVMACFAIPLTMQKLVSPSSPSP